MLNKVKQAVADFLQANPEKTAREVTIACFSLAFKPNTNDLRERPALAITQQIAATHPSVESNIEELLGKLADKLNLASIETAQAEADVIVTLVGYRSF